MNINNLSTFIKLAKIDKANQFCILTATESDITAKSTSAEGSIMTKVVMSETFRLPEPVAIHDMDKMVKMLSLHDTDVDVTYKSNKLVFSDPSTKTEYVVADLTFFKNKRLKNEPAFTGEIQLTSDVIKKLVQTMKVMSDSAVVGIILEDEESIIQVGNRDSFTNKVIFKLPSKKSNISRISGIFYLNLQLVKQIIETNASCNTGKLCIADAGLVKFEYTYDNITSEYYLLTEEI